MHLQRNTEGGGRANTDTHRGRGGGLNGGSITSSYRTAKAEARQLEVHGNMEHCLEIVDSSVIFLGAELHPGPFCWDDGVRPGWTLADPFFACSY